MLYALQLSVVLSESWLAIANGAWKYSPLLLSPVMYVCALVTMS